MQIYKSPFSFIALLKIYTWFLVTQLIHILGLYIFQAVFDAKLGSMDVLTANKCLVRIRGAYIKKRIQKLSNFFFLWIFLLTYGYICHIIDIVAHVTEQTGIEEGNNSFTENGCFAKQILCMKNTVRIKPCFLTHFLL